MPPSVHRVLVHGADAMRQFPLPIGVYSEEPQESRQKHNRAYRSRHASKTSREDTMRDQVHYLLVSSDLEIVRIIREDLEKPRRRTKKRGAAEVNPDISQLLLAGSSILEEASEISSDDGESDPSEDEAVLT